MNKEVGSGENRSSNNDNPWDTLANVDTVKSKDEKEIEKIAKEQHELGFKGVSGQYAAGLERFAKSPTDVSRYGSPEVVISEKQEADKQANYIKTSLALLEARNLSGANDGKVLEIADEINGMADKMMAEIEDKKKVDTDVDGTVIMTPDDHRLAGIANSLHELSYMVKQRIEEKIKVGQMPKSVAPEPAPVPKPDSGLSHSEGLLARDPSTGKVMRYSDGRYTDTGMRYK